MTGVEPDLIDAHVHSSHHRSEVMESEIVGCFYCLEVYRPLEITEWLDKGEDAVGTCAFARGAESIR